MSAKRRLAKLESSLPPRQAVLHWLNEAHEHGSLEAYLAGTLDEPGPSPLVALTERVTTATRRAHAREPRPMVREAEHRAAMDTVFLIMLVLELEHEASEVIRIGSLRLAALDWELRARQAEGAADRRGWATWRATVLDLAADVVLTETVRRTLEGRFLDGRGLLFPITLTAWQELRDGVSALLEARASTPGGRRRRRPDVATIDAGTQRMATDQASRLADRVRARTIDLLGDHAGAAAMSERALRGRA